MVSVGDSLPSVLLQEGAPDQTVDLSKELRDGVVVGVPGKNDLPTSGSQKGYGTCYDTDTCDSCVLAHLQPRPHSQIHLQPQRQGLRRHLRRERQRRLRHGSVEEVPRPLGRIRRSLPGRPGG